MPEAYALFRRFFDRMPFAFDPAHAQYISVYVRLLAEMGKDREMMFYRNIVENLHKKRPDPNVAYSLVVLCLFSEPKEPERAKQLLDSCLAEAQSSPVQSSAVQSSELAIKAKLLLASYYSTYKDDYAACEAIVRSIAEPQDLHLQRMLAIWRANLLRNRGDLNGAETMLRELMKSVSWEEDWYTVFSAQVILGILQMQQEKFDAAHALLAELRGRTQNLKLKCVARQLSALEQKLESASRLGSCTLNENNGALSFQYRSKNLRIKPNTSGGKLLLLFLKRKQLAKEEIIEAIYSRKYVGETDDALVYYQVHSLRKQLEKTGLPPEAIQTAAGGYIWRPEISNSTETEELR